MWCSHEQQMFARQDAHVRGRSGCWSCSEPECGAQDALDDGMQACTGWRHGLDEGIMRHALPFLLTQVKHI